MSVTAIIVDEQDNEIGTKSTSQLEKGDIVRISSIWLENSKGQVLLAQRSMHMNHDPGLWAPAAAGTIEPGETPEENAYKEVEEEIGVSNITLTPLKSWMFWRSDGTGRYIHAFKGTLDRDAEDFVFQEDEVEQIMWIDKETLKKDLHENPAKYVESETIWSVYFDAD